jgi:hypothetical protein
VSSAVTPHRTLINKYYLKRKIKGFGKFFENFPFSASKGLFLDNPPKPFFNGE